MRAVIRNNSPLTENAYPLWKRLFHYYKHITAELLNEAHELGIQVFVWTVDSKNDMERLIAMGIDGIITNRPDILKDIIRED
jgi:glycerophosphoryl diester phosphodiesterase